MPKMTIDHNYINNLLKQAESATESEISKALDKAINGLPLNHLDVAVLLHLKDAKVTDRLFDAAKNIKQSIYGNRVVLFAPLYISDYCVNNCVYCGYKKNNNFQRRKLNADEIRAEVEVLLKNGHKRLALEFGEDDENCPIDYIVQAIEAVYSAKCANGEIRRVNINIAATTVENYARLASAGIGTYILFQETYHQPTYMKMHTSGPKSDYAYHLTAFDRANQAGIDDVGGGVLFGLHDYRFEVLALLLHNEHLERTYGAGFHTISVPRLKPSAGMNLSNFKHLVTDADFKKIIAILRIAVPHTGIILSTRESSQFRKEAINIGISQISAGSATGVGSYRDDSAGTDTQFEVADHRSVSQIIADLIEVGIVPSYCTACYRKGRTGDRFFELARTGQIKRVCEPNAIMTLAEYICDYGTPELKKKGLAFVRNAANNLEDEVIRKQVCAQLDRVLEGKRDLYF